MAEILSKSVFYDMIVSPYFVNLVFVTLESKILDLQNIYCANATTIYTVKYVYSANEMQHFYVPLTSSMIKSFVLSLEKMENTLKSATARISKYVIRLTASLFQMGATSHNTA